MAEIQDYLFSPDDLPGEGADVRVRPEPVRAVTFGQGSPLPGPKIQGIQFVWSSPLTVDSSIGNGIGDPDKGLIHFSVVQESPELFMSETNYQEFLNSIEE